MKKIHIDAGHGGTDSGANGSGILEKVINLKVAILLKAFLSEYDCIITMTRETDVTVTPDERVALINKINPDLCVSVHHNSAGTPTARGGEVIHSHSSKLDDQLAEDILKNWKEILGLPIRRSFTKLNDSDSDYYFMIRRIFDNDTHSIITEGGFLSNENDVALLEGKDSLKKEAEGIGLAVVKFLGLQKRQAPEPVRDWKDEIVAEAHRLGLITDFEQWKQKKDEPAPVWFVLTVANRLKGGKE